MTRSTPLRSHFPSSHMFKHMPPLTCSSTLLPSHVQPNHSPHMFQHTPPLTSTHPPLTNTPSPYQYTPPLTCSSTPLSSPAHPSPHMFQLHCTPALHSQEQRDYLYASWEPDGNTKHTCMFNKSFGQWKRTKTILVSGKCEKSGKKKEG